MAPPLLMRLGTPETKGPNTHPLLLPTSSGHLNLIKLQTKSGADRCPQEFCQDATDTGWNPTVLARALFSIAWEDVYP